MNLRQSLGCVSSAVLLAASAAAQTPIDWSSTYGNTTASGASQEQVTSCAVAPNGDVFVALFSYPLPWGAMWPEHRVLCYSNSGALLSNIRLNAASNQGFTWPIVVADSNGFAHTLWTQGSDFSLQSCELTRTNAAGAIVWSRTIDAFPGFAEKAVDVVLDENDNSLVLSTRTAPTFTVPYSAVTKIDVNGHVLWTVPYVAGATGPTAQDLALLPNGGVVGVSNGTTSTVTALDANGALLFETNFEFAPGGYESVRRVAADSSGAVACVGYVNDSSSTSAAIALVRAGGSVAWRRTWDAPQGGNTNFGNVGFASDGSIWVAGNSTLSGTHHTHVLHYDRTGELLSVSSWRSSGHVASLIAGDAGDVFIAGNRFTTGPNTEASWTRFDSAGQRVAGWSASAPTFYSAFAMARAPGSRLVISGTVQINVVDARTVQFDLSAEPTAYCGAEVNLLGCTPAVTFSGTPSASASDGFAVAASNLVNQRPAIWIHGTTGPANVPFQSGTLCVQAPLLRTPVESSAGAPASVTDCSGHLSIDFNAFASGALGGNPSPLLSVAGTSVWTQAWSRDPGSSSGTNLTSALSYVVRP